MTLPACQLCGGRVVQDRGPLDPPHCRDCGLYWCGDARLALALVPLDLAFAYRRAIPRRRQAA